MTIELKLLVWSTALALIQMLIAVLAAMTQVGLMPLVGNRENLPAFEGWAGRAHEKKSKENQNNRKIEAERTALPQNGSSLTRTSHAAVLATVKDATRR